MIDTARLAMTEHLWHVSASCLAASEPAVHSLRLETKSRLLHIITSQINQAVIIGLKNVTFHVTKSSDNQVTLDHYCLSNFIKLIQYFHTGKYLNLYTKIHISAQTLTFSNWAKITPQERHKKKLIKLCCQKSRYS